jgi:hypothetical protein
VPSSRIPLAQQPLAWIAGDNDLGDLQEYALQLPSESTHLPEPKADVAVVAQLRLAVRSLYSADHLMTCI